MMDTSETYIRMRLAATPDMGMGMPIESPCNFIVDNVWVDTKGDWYYSTEHEHSQLERQDQLQEILEDVERWQTSIQSITMLCAFARFCGIDDEDAEGRSNIHIRKGSLEQLWLAFVMKERYNKVWSNGGWVNA